MGLAVGTTLGTFEITGLLGKGGMGEVYRAVDSKLGREVAIKVLPDVFAIDAERLARFEREARVLATLDHPNIGALYDFQEADGHRFLVMQIVEGETLADRIDKGAIPVKETLPLFAQIAEALEVAHAGGIVHRDLKPANIKIDESGNIKVLDFGLAMNPDGEVITIASPTDETKPGDTPPSKITMDGAIIGTPAYMSPEQARGKDVDKRADIWAFGCCLYEGLTGKMPFDEPTISDTLASVLKQDVDLDALPNDTPWKLRELIERCLEKEVQYRLRDIGDAWSDLKRLTTDSGRLTAAAEVTQAPQSKSSAKLLFWVVMGFTVGAVIAGSLLLQRAQPEPSAQETVLRFSIDPPDNWIGFEPGFPAISRDGTLLVYMHAAIGLRPELMLRKLDGFDDEARPLKGTKTAYSPSFSPDGNWVAYFGESNTGVAGIYKVRVSGGEPVFICNYPLNSRLLWGDDNNIYMGSIMSGLSMVSASGGTMPVMLTEADLGNGEYSHIPSWFDPNTRTLLYTIRNTKSEHSIVVLSLDSMESKIIVANGSYGKLLPTGHLVYSHENRLWAVEFDSENLETVGEPNPVIENITEYILSGYFTFSNDGTLVYTEGASLLGSSVLKSMIWVDAEGEIEPIPFDNADFNFPVLSPDGKRIAVYVGTLIDGNLWIYDLSGRPPYPITFDEDSNTRPLWTPDESRIVYSTSRDFKWTTTAPGSIEPETLIGGIAGSDSRKFATSWSPSGKELIFTEQEPNRSTELDQAPFEMNIRMLSIETQEIHDLVNTPFNEGFGKVSPDGKWLAYGTTLTGRGEVWVQRFPDSTVGKVTPLSTAGGKLPLWSRDGKELYYLTGDSSQMMAVTVPANQEDEWPTPRVLFDLDISLRVSALNSYDVAPDGRFLFVVEGLDTEEKSTETQLRVVVNWFEELKRLAPIPETN